VFEQNRHGKCCDMITSSKIMEPEEMAVAKERHSKHVSTAMNTREA
jgi:hypothetical protein